MLTIDDCSWNRVSGGPLGPSTVYLFSCNTSCTHWVFYVLEFPTPPSGAYRALPFRADTVSYASQNILARDQILRVLSKGDNVSIVASPGRVRLVAQCVYQLQSSPYPTYLYRDGIMLRDGK